MDKAWVWLPRASLEYEQGATKFVYESKRLLGNVGKMFCPCIQCRNVCHQSVGTVLDHLVINGMDQKYKRNRCWFKHGEKRKDEMTDVQTSESEAYNLKIKLVKPVTPPEDTSRKSMASATNSTSSSKGKKQKCFLLDCNGSGTRVAQGRVSPSEPTDTVHFVPLGPNASKVMIEVPKVPNARVWRPNAEYEFISDAVGTLVAWPNDKIIFV